METCKVCNGKGKVNETRRSFIGVFNTVKVCDNCHGKGQVPKEKCHTCHGEGVVDRQQEIAVKLPVGIEDGEMVRLIGMGEAISNGISGDMYVRVHVKPHQYIRKQGFDLVMDVKVKLTEAITGGEQMLKLLTEDGEVNLKDPRWDEQRRCPAHQRQRRAQRAGQARRPSGQSEHRDAEEIVESCQTSH